MDFSFRGAYYFALADELAAASQFAPAADEYEQVIQLRPGLSIARLDHGVMLARLDRFDEALLEFQEILRRDPDNQQAREYFGRVQSWKNSGRQ